MASNKDAQPRHLRIDAPVAPELGGGFEGLWAAEVGRGRYRLENIPFFTTGLSAGDIVFAEPEGPGLRPIVRGVSIHGGHSTFYLRLCDETEPSTFEARWQRLAAMGCRREHGLERLYAVDVPPRVDIVAVRKVLRSGRRARVWVFEEIANGHFT